MPNFNLDVFTAAFEASLEMLAQAEVVTKRELRELSRTVLVAHHETGDVSWINRLLGVLTPMNRRTAVLYFKEFSGFSTNDTDTVFVKKSRKNYDDDKAKCMEFLAEPANNIWTWAERNVDVEKKPFNVEKVGQVVKKAIKEKVSQADIIREVIKNGVEVESIIALLSELIPAEKQEETMSKIADGFGMEVV